MNRVRNGFTLIELLVVIAIIAILAAILFPVFAQARESARQTSCLSNTKQVGLGILQYVQDYDEHFPLWAYDTPPPANGTPDQPWGVWKNVRTGWEKQVQPYVKNIQIFHCPSTGDGQNRSAGDNSDSPTGATNYALNGHLSKRDGNAGNGLATVRFPAVTILLAENHRVGASGETTSELGWMEWGYNGGHASELNGDNNADTGWDSNTYGTEVDKLCHTGNGTSWGATAALRKHKGGANYNFVDGHSKWYNGNATCVVWDRTDTGSGPRNESGATMTYIP